MRRLIFPVLLGVAGCAVLIWLGTWQIQRLAWKEEILARIESRIAADPVPLPDRPTFDAHNYTNVVLSGVPKGDELHVLMSGTAAGTGFRVISAFVTTNGRRVLLDQGLLALDQKTLPSTVGDVDITGNLIWPDDRNSMTPDPDLSENIWFARDVPQMADALGTEEVMVVLRTSSMPDPRLTPLPVDTGNIKNDHLEYAITWFLLAIVWAVMSVFLIVRTIRPKDA